MDLPPSNSQRRESVASSHHSIHSAPSGRNTPARPRAHTVREPSIRIRRVPSANLLSQQHDSYGHGQSFGDAAATETGRRRSASDPERSHLRVPPAGGNAARPRSGILGHEPLPEIVEGTTMNVVPETAPENSEETEKKGRLRRYRGRFFRRSSNGNIAPEPSSNPTDDEYESGLVDYLDLVGMHH